LLLQSSYLKLRKQYSAQIRYIICKIGGSTPKSGCEVTGGDIQVTGFAENISQ
jgi:hypothetical protein